LTTVDRKAAGVSHEPVKKKKGWLAKLLGAIREVWKGRGREEEASELHV